jgi:hypothetical protein
LPADRDREWFVGVFCDGEDPGDVDDISEHLGSFNLYDPINLVAAIPSIRERFFKPELVGSGNVSLIGKTRDDHQVIDIDGLRQFIMEHEIYALSEGV